MTLAIIQVRTGSTRFPNKAFADLHGKPLIQHVIERAKQIQGVRFVVLAVPFSDVAVFSTLGVPVYGFDGLDDGDLIGRFWKVRERYPTANTIIRLTGDCPLLNPRIAEEVLSLYHRDPFVEYASNVAPGYVDGEDVEVFSAGALKLAQRLATEPADREHIGPWMRRHVRCATLAPTEDCGGLKTSIDTPEDLERVRGL